MSRLTPRAVARALATFLADVPPAKQPAALKACARFIERARLLHQAEHILRALDSELLRRQGVVRAEVAAATPLSHEVQAELARLLGALVKSSVVLRIETRPSLLAGFRAEVDDLLVDASLRGILGRLRSELRTWSPFLLPSAHD